MKQSDIFYGLESQEQLFRSPEEVIEEVLDDACLCVGEPFERIASRIKWPIRIIEFKRQSIVDYTISDMAQAAVERVLDYLDESYSNPDGTDFTESTSSMKDAAIIFVRAVVAEYVPWLCEPSGVVHIYSQERAESIKLAVKGEAETK